MKKLNFLFFLVLIALPLFSISNAYSQKNDKFIQSRQAIPNRYIVVLEDDNDVIRNFPNNPIGDEKVRRFTRELSLLYGGQVDRQYSRAIKGYAAAMPLQQALALSRDPRVKYVEEDYFIYKDQTQNNAPAGLDRIDQRNLPLNSIYNYSTTGAGVHVYVIDSGIRATHTEFAGRIGNGQDFVNDGQGTNDCDGHGTHVAGIIGGTTYGVAKNVTLHPLRIFPCEGASGGSSSLAAIDWITTNRVPNAPGVVNMSLGGGYSTTGNNAVANSIALTGLTYVVSAGNENNDACDKSPASTPQAITVGSTRASTDQRSSFSNYGGCVDVFAPGSSITSTWFTSDTAAAVLSGTSMSAPNVAGIAARFLQNNPNATPAQVENSIINSATNGVVIDPAVGSPNRLAFADVVFNNNTPTPPTPGPAPSVRIPERGVGDPYPSQYVISGGPTVIGNILVNINGFSHTATGEVSFLLEGPTGARFLLQSGVGLNEDANNISYAIYDGGSVMAENTAIQGSSFKPTAYDLIDFPAPGPGTNYNNPGPVNSGTATLASTFGGTNPNGVWKLYVKDENLGDRGRIDSWSVTTFAPQPPSTPSNFQVASKTDTQVNLSWNASPASENVTSYILNVNGQPPITGITSTNYSLSGLTPGTDYQIILEAVNAGGKSSSAVAYTRTTGINVKLWKQGFDYLGIAWDSGNIGAVNYNIRINGSRVISNVLGNFGINSYTVYGLFPNNTYAIEMQSVNSTGQVSAWSVPVNFSTLSSTVTLSAAPTSVAPNGSVTANWTAQNNRPGTDWIGVYQAGAPNSSLFAWQYVTAGTSGSNSFQMPSIPGLYELRYFTDNSFNLAVSTHVPVVVPAVNVTLSAAPTSVAPNGSVTANWTAQNNRPGTDWIGVYQAGAPNSSLFAWQYVTAGTSGSNSFQMPSIPGLYELRYFTDNSFNLAASSQVTITVPAVNVTLSAAPTSVAPNGSVTANWTAQNNRPGTDWIGVYQAGAPNSSLFAWQYVTAGTSGSNSFQMPSIPGLYELRYFTDNSFNLAVSTHVPVVVPSVNVTLSAAPTSVAPNGSVTANWTAQNNRPGTDWIGVYQAGAPNSSLFAWQYVTAGTSGSNSFQMPSIPGLYELRYFTDNSFNLAASSNQVIVNNSQSSMLKFSPNAIARTLSLTQALTSVRVTDSTDLFVSCYASTQGNWNKNYESQASICSRQID